VEENDHYTGLFLLERITRRRSPVLRRLLSVAEAPSMPLSKKHHQFSSRLHYNIVLNTSRTNLDHNVVLSSKKGEWGGQEDCSGESFGRVTDTHDESDEEKETKGSRECWVME
jgi:hypothetical protein